MVSVPHSVNPQAHPCDRDCALAAGPGACKAKAMQKRPPYSRNRGPQAAPDRAGRAAPGSKDRFRVRPPGRSGRDEPAGGPVVLYGWHTVSAALQNPNRHVRRLWLTENAARRLSEAGISLPEQHELVRPDAIDRRLGPDAVHQGLLAEADPLPSLSIDEVEQHGLVLALDQVTDPHNVGAVLRSAAAFGVKAIVTTARHSPEATGVLAKSASGALEHVPIAIVRNLAQALEQLRRRGFQLIGLDSLGDGDLAAAEIRLPAVLVLGAEGKGLRQLTRATCDMVARLDLPGQITSLNVSNAAALALYIAFTRGRA